MLQTGVKWPDIREKISSRTFGLLDLRSEKEFATGHIPGARNLPLLNNEERHEIGCLYKQSGKHAAVHRGLEMFSLKSEEFMESCHSMFRQFDVLVVYCWRGGMRSRLVGQWLAAAGLNIMVLEGGYKNFRRTVLAELASLARHDKLILNGRTGSGKTLLLNDLEKAGYPAIDLEGIARHRGSAFGALAWEEESPTQQNFENQLADRYLEVSASDRLVMEIESVIGPVSLPKELRQSVKASPMVYVERDFSDRVRLLTGIYGTSWGDKEARQSQDALQMLKKFLSGKEYSSLQQALQTGNLEQATTMLLRLRYDKAYDKSLHRHRSQMLASFNLTTDYKKAFHFISSWLSEL